MASCRISNRVVMATAALALSACGGEWFRTDRSFYWPDAGAGGQLTELSVAGQGQGGAMALDAAREPGAAGGGAGGETNGAAGETGGTQDKPLVVLRDPTEQERAHAGTAEWIRVLRNESDEYVEGARLAVKLELSRAAEQCLCEPTLTDKSETVTVDGTTLTYSWPEMQAALWPSNIKLMGLDCPGCDLLWLLQREAVYVDGVLVWSIEP